MIVDTSASQKRALREIDAKIQQLEHELKTIKHNRAVYVTSILDSKDVASTQEHTLTQDYNFEIAE